LRRAVDQAFADAVAQIFAVGITACIYKGEHIPFDFMAGNTMLPAGTYTITEATPGVLQIRNEKLGSDAAFVQAHSLETPKPQDSGKLIFNRYGDTYFLNQVWSDISSYSVPKSQSEISLSNELAAENPPDVIRWSSLFSLQ
jgi:hypothetical protein